jgi:membrane protein
MIRLRSRAAAAVHAARARLRLPPGTAAVTRRMRVRTAELGAFVKLAFLRFWDDNCFQAAAALTYTALLALVPLMTLSVGILSAFPAFTEAQESLQNMIFNTLVPQVGEAVLEHVEAFSERAGSLTAVGIVGLMITAVLLLATIEGAFNAIWRVREMRPLLTRFLSYWAVLTVSPVLVAASISATSQVLAGTQLEDESWLWQQSIGFMPLLFEFIGLSILYRIIPNRPIRTRDAMAGGAVAAVLFEVSKTGYAYYLSNFPLYETVYGALAVFPTFLLWLYLGWSVVLLGAVVAATLPDWRTGKQIGGGGHGEMLPVQRMILAFGLLRELAAACRLGVPISRRTLLHRVPVSGPMLDDTLDRLRKARFVARTDDDRWLLSRDLSVTTLYDLSLAAGIGIRGHPEHFAGSIRGLEGDWQHRVTERLEKADVSAHEILGEPLSTLLLEPSEGSVTTLKVDQRR